jgi:glycosyltransferase involved in cell wall biosynthesis
MIDPKETPKVSIITPCYEHAAFLPDCLNSLIDQTYPHWECQVMDDGSTDNSQAVAQSYAYKDPRIKFKKQPNQGPSAARNHAIALTQGEYILPLDADDKLAPTFLEKTLHVFHTNPKVKIVYTAGQYFGKYNHAMELKPFSYQELLRGNIIPITALYKRRDYLQTDGYDENMKSGWEDWDFWLSMLNPQDEVHKIDEVLFYYRRKEASRNDSVSEEEAYVLRKYIYEKHYEAYKKHFEDPINLAYKVKVLQKEVHHLRNRDLASRIKHRLASLMENFRGNRE